MIRQHWDKIEDSAKEHLARLEDLAIPQRLRLTEKEQVERYLSYGPDDFKAIHRWLSEKTGDPTAAQKEFDGYVSKMEKLRSRHGKER